ncbi:MAG: MFS transporter, partial [Candidatus Nealsonbacteria bacterium]|nr:MFS transporter [Candidatus Nealsonbacteria bacterium]
RDAILAASTKKEKRGKGFGIHRALDSAGSVLGAIVAFVLFWYLGMNFQSIFLLAGIIGFFSLIPLFFVKERGGEEKTQKGFKVSLKSLSRSLRMFILVATLFTLGNFSYMFFVLESQESFEGKMAVGIPILLYALYNTSYSLFAVPAGVLSDKIGRRKVLLAGYSLFGLVCLGFMFAGSLSLFVVLFLLFGLNYSLVNATQRALVSDLAEKDVRGTALGTFHMMTSLATLPGGLIAGHLWDMNSTLLFSYGAGISFLSVILFLIVCKTCQSNE